MVFAVEADVAGSGGIPAWVWLVLAAVALVGIVAGVVAARMRHPDGVVRYRDLSAPTRFVPLRTELESAGAAAAVAELDQLTSDDVPVSVAIRRLRGPADDLVVTPYRGWLRIRHGFDVVVKGDEPTHSLPVAVVVPGADTVTTSIPGRRVHRVFSGIADDLALAGDAEGAAALQRWLAQRRTGPGGLQRGGTAGASDQDPSALGPTSGGADVGSRRRESNP